MNFNYSDELEKKAFQLTDFQVYREYRSMISRLFNLSCMFMAFGSRFQKIVTGFFPLILLAFSNLSNMAVQQQDPLQYFIRT